jgi:hypothetical protein
LRRKWLCKPENTPKGSCRRNLRNDDRANQEKEAEKAAKKDEWTMEEAGVRPRPPILKGLRACAMARV